MTTTINLERYCFRPTFGCTRSNMEAPFNHGDHTIATNGHILVRVPRYLDVEDSGPNVGPTLRHLKSDGALEPLPPVMLPAPATCDCCRGTGQVHLCDECDGSGCQECNQHGEMAATGPQADTCGRCDGDKVCWPRDAAVTLTSSIAVAPRYYLMLVDLPRVYVDLAAGDGMPISFTFEGGDGMLMPLRVNYFQKPLPSPAYLPDLRAFRAAS